MLLRTACALVFPARKCGSGRSALAMPTALVSSLGRGLGYEVSGLDRARRRRGVRGGGSQPARLCLARSNQRRSRREHQRSYRGVPRKPGSTWRPRAAADHGRDSRGPRVSGLPRVSGREVVKALREIGYERDRQRGSHVVLRQMVSPYRRLTVPDHKEVAKGTMRAIIRQAGLTVDEFRALL